MPVYAAAPTPQYQRLFYLTSEWLTLWSPFASVSHRTTAHLLENLAILGLFGWQVERHEPRHRYVLFFLLVAYVALCVESFVTSRLLKARVLTIGSSGGVLAVATYATVTAVPARRFFRDWYPSSFREGVVSLAHNPSVVLLVVGTVAIPATLLGDFLYPTGDVGRYAHLTGVLVGGAYGLYALWRDY
ncbi:rhomboid family intramembrane serine protease [Halospeciosus flavus]